MEQLYLDALARCATPPGSNVPTNDRAEQTPDHGIASRISRPLPRRPPMPRLMSMTLFVPALSRAQAGQCRTESACPSTTFPFPTRREDVNLPRRGMIGFGYSSTGACQATNTFDPDSVVIVLDVAGSCSEVMIKRRGLEPWSSRASYRGLAVTPATTAVHHTQPRASLGTARAGWSLCAVRATTMWVSPTRQSTLVHVIRRCRTRDYAHSDVRTWRDAGRRRVR